MFGIGINAGLTSGFSELSTGIKRCFRFSDLHFGMCSESFRLPIVLRYATEEDTSNTTTKLKKQKWPPTPAFAD